MYDLKFTLKLDLEEFRTFIAVAQLRSFSGAAELLHKTTSAISYRIKMLEARVGVMLFERSTRTISLTPAGEMLLEKASLMFEWMQSVPDELKQIRDGIEPHFTLVVNNLLYEPRAGAKLLAHLHQQFPRTEFKLELAVFMGVWDAMQYGGGHFAIGAPGFHSISDDLLAEPAGVITWMMVAAPSHPLARAEGPRSVEMLRRYPVVNIEDTSLRLKKRSAWRLAGQQELLVPDLETKIACYEAGMGIGFLPSPIALEAIRGNRLAEIVNVPVGRSPFPLSFAWRNKDAGKITAHMRHLLAIRDPIVAPFLRLISPSGQ